ncbi:MAG: 5-formyltetrahydrofolate cyclo-ligase, partial [Bacteroidales bacterium]|nr:5-formyltetrahydrofolate cyclo-ligase [Bacteroidales bacterium]
MDKHELRKQIKAAKKSHTKEQLQQQSVAILEKIEQLPEFQSAQKVMLYFSLPDEVQTAEFVEKWRFKKTLVLPTVVGDDIIPVQLTPETGFATGDFNIQEPQNNPYKGDFDLIIVPGVAFDRNGNRL